MRDRYAQVRDRSSNVVEEARGDRGQLALEARDELLAQLPRHGRRAAGVGRESLRLHSSRPAPASAAFSAAFRDRPHGQHRLARLPKMHPLGHPVDEQVQHRMGRQIPAAEGLAITPQPLRDLRHRGAHQPTQAPPRSVNAHSMSRTESPCAYIAIARRSSSSVRPLCASRTCGTANSIDPSALYRRCRPWSRSIPSLTAPHRGPRQSPARTLTRQKSAFGLPIPP